MTPADRDLIRLINRRVASMQPEMARALRAFYRILADEIGAANVVNLIKSGRIEDIINEDTLDRATIPIRQGIRDSMERGFRLTVPDIAEAVRKPPSVVRPQVFFDVISPRITKAITELESRTLDTLKENVHVVVRETVSAGLTRGEHPTAISRELREAIGLSPQQSRFVRNSADDLRNLDPRYFTRELRDKRFDATIKKAFAAGKAPDADVIEKVTAGYARKYTKYNAELNTRAAALDSYRLAQYEAYKAAIDRDIVPADQAQKVWVHFDEQKNPREDHKAWGGTVVDFDQPFPDGQQQAGLGYFNCRCTTRYQIRKRAVYPLPATA